jgi:hypothetical protein
MSKKKVKIKAAVSKQGEFYMKYKMPVRNEETGQ